VQAKNPAYFNSLWLGTAWNVLLLPTRAWRNFWIPLLSGHPVIALLLTLIFTPLETLYCLLCGVFGRLRGVGLSESVMRSARIMTDQEAYITMKGGNFDLLREIPW
jgi:hypothetical protein